jgi:hypothetical protein
MTHRISPRVAHQCIGGEAVLVDLAGARLLGLNATGSFIWSLLADGHDDDAIARVFGERYGLDATSARRELQAFVGTLVERGLVVVAP